ncbi:MAG: NAD(P)H-dependent oxidoreductase [Candidatus Omnitrophota bacterium]|nr:MAG: NAD(P)H-dependent oxidoreductase [Candidatus Omnitrophota bacterium]
MNIAIVYYSYSGNTHKAAGVLEEILKERGNSVRRLRLEASGESRNFFVQVVRSLFRRKAETAPIERDFSGYDLVIFATPVWAREMVPAMREFLGKIEGLSGKKAITFVTYGSGFGKEHCLDSLESVLQQKGAACLGRFSISQDKVGDKALIEDSLNKIMRL